MAPPLGSWIPKSFSTFRAAASTTRRRETSLPMVSLPTRRGSHAPDWPIMALTLPVGLLSIEHYRRWPNLWVLGTAHALLGTFAYYFLLGRDPLAPLLR